MSYTELEHGYQGLRKTRPAFYVGEDSALGQTTRPSLKGDGEAEEDLGCKQVVVGICAMEKKSQSKPMREILTRLQEFQYLRIHVFSEEVIVMKPVEEWPLCDCLVSFHSKGFPLDKAIQYASLRHPYVINNLHMQYDIMDRRKVYSILEQEGIEIPRYAVLDRDSPDPKHHELIESEDHVEVNGVVFNKPFVEKPVSAEDHNIYIYYPTSAGGGSQRLFRKIGSRSSVYSPESRIRKTGSYIYEDFMPTDGTDVKVYTVGPDYAHAEARKSPALDGKVERDSEGKEVRYPVILSNAEKLISRKVCLAFKQTVCGFDLLRANGKSYVCDVNGFSFVKNSNKYYDDCAKILGNMILRELAPTLHIPWSVPFQLDDPPFVPTTFGKMMELRCVVAVIRHGDRTPKQKMKVEVRHPKFFEIFEKYGGQADGHVKLKRPKQLQEVLDISRYLLNEIEQKAAPELAEKQSKLEQLKSVLEMYGHFSGINRKVQMKYQPKGRPKGSSSDDGNGPGEPSLVLIVKWGGELTPAGRVQAEELGRIFRCMYPGGQGRHYSNGEYAGTQGLGLLRLHSTYRHDLKIYASDEGRVQMTAAAFAKGLLALEGELTPILVQMVKSANTNGLLDNDTDASKHQTIAKAKLHAMMQQDREFTSQDKMNINPCNALSISMALDFVKNPVKCCERVHVLIQKLMNIVRVKKDDLKTKDALLYHGETWEMMGRRWGKIEKDFCTKNHTFDISKIPDIYDCIKYDLQHNQHTLQFDQAEELYLNSKYLADIVIPQEYGLSKEEKLTISQGILTPLLKKIRADLQRNIEEPGEESVNRLNPRYSHGVSSPGRHVRTRLYFTSESHIHSLLTVLRFGGLIENGKDEQWRRAMEYVSMVSELNYMSQIVIMLYEDPTKDPCSDERFHIELHFSPGVNCCVQKNLPPGPGFRPHSRNEQRSVSNSNSINNSYQSENEDTSPNESPGPTDSPPINRKLQHLKVSDPIPIRGKDLTTEEKGTSQEQRSKSYDQGCRPVKEPSTDEPKSDSYGNTSLYWGHFSGVPFNSSNSFTMGEESWTDSYDLSFTKSLSLPANSARHWLVDIMEGPKKKLAELLEIQKKKLTDMIEKKRLDTRDEWTGVRPKFPHALLRAAHDSRRKDKLDLRALDLAHLDVILDSKQRSIGAAGLNGSNRELKAKKIRDLEDEEKKKKSRDRLETPNCDRTYSNSAGATLTYFSDGGSTWYVPPSYGMFYNTVVSGSGGGGGGNGSNTANPGYGHRTINEAGVCVMNASMAMGKRHNVSSTSSVFSTAVISGAASAPNLTHIITNTGSVSEGCGGVPAIRPLETLHNALSLKQLDGFLEKVTTAPFHRTPASSPPRQLSMSHATSPTGTGWDPPSFVSSGASSPAALSDVFLTQGSGCGLLDSGHYNAHRDSIEVAEYYNASRDNSHFSPIPDDVSGEETPVSISDSEQEEEDSTQLLEADTTVIAAAEAPRARIQDICWDPADSTSLPGDASGKKPSRFVCTSVPEVDVAGGEPNDEDTVQEVSGRGHRSEDEEPSKSGSTSPVVVLPSSFKDKEAITKGFDVDR